MEKLSPSPSYPRKSKLEDLFVTKTDNTLIQLFRYTFVGGTAFVIDFAALFILTEYAHVYYLTSAALAFMLGLTTNYSLSVMWVFDKRAVRSKWMEFAIFGFIGVIGLGLNELFIWFFTENMQLYYMVSKIASTILVYFWNFFARKVTLFS